MFKLKDVRRAFRSHRVVWRVHAQQRMLERDILRRDVAAVVESGELIEPYPDSKPYPSCLINGVSEGRALHVVVAYDIEAEQVYVITAYEPDLLHFEAGFMTRRRGQNG